MVEATHGGCKDFRRSSVMNWLFGALGICSLCSPTRYDDGCTGFLTSCTCFQIHHLSWFPPIFISVPRPTKPHIPCTRRPSRRYVQPNLSGHALRTEIRVTFKTLLRTTIMRGRMISTDLKYTILALGSLHLVSEITALTAVSHRQIYCIRKSWETTGCVKPECTGKKTGRPRFLTLDEEAVSLPSAP